MKFWSKGLGERTVSLRLSDGEAIKSGDRLYVKGQTEEPVSWDYIMPLRGADFVEFVTLLREPTVVRYLYQSPNRWRLYLTLLVGGVRFLGLLLRQSVTGRRVPAPEEPTIEVPPPRVRKRRRLDARRTGERHRRLRATQPERPEQAAAEAAE
ncbi:MAG: hypothetical protein M5U31_07305 [Acidimicrobiia bacterium]|nr:hypothetical protein [Acidimicrobiia bacterium]